MRKRNRKKTVHGSVFPVPFAGAVVVSVVMALAYVWLGFCHDSLGRELKSLEKQRDLLNKKRLNEEYRWMQEKSPVNLARALNRHNLEMTWPQRRQVVHMRDPLPAENSFASLNAELLEPPRLGRVVMND